MFGYVKAFKPELRVCEFELYKAVYCGLCKDMGRRFGFWARFTLSYDFTFLALLHMALAEHDPELKPGRCEFNPLKKINCCQPGDSLTFAGDIAMLMLWHKLEDDHADGGFWKRLAAGGAMAFAGSAYRRAAIANPELAGTLRSAMAEQAALEQQGCTEPDRVCHPSAQMLGSVLETLSQNAGQRRVLYRLGYLLGRYVYLCDALDDLEQDEQEGGYNPLALAWAARPKEEQQSGESLRQQAVGSLYMTIAEAGTAFELLEVNRLEPILQNIIFLGLRKTVESISLPHKERPKQQKF
ncbi:MAG: DUF5685 family protein [Angelakisella sp.]